MYYNTSDDLNIAMSLKKFASLLILEKNGKVLLIRRFNTGYEDGKYTLPSGKVDEGETFTDAAIREALEEVNAEISHSNINSVHVLHRKKDDVFWIDNFFLCKKWNNEIKNAEPHKCDDLKWFDIENLPSNTIPFIKHALEQVFFHKKSYSEYGWNGEE